MDVNDTSRQRHRNQNTDSQNNTSSKNNEELLKCTYCRRLLEKKKTVLLNENKYNLNNDIVRSCLSP